MADIGRGGGLRTIFSVFLGLMLSAFIGVGVYTFHRPPAPFEEEIKDLNRRADAIRNSAPAGELTGADREEVQRIESRRSELVDAAAEARKPWGRSTSIILIVLATVAMAVSLARPEQSPVFSTGFLLGGLFTMIYGVGWIIASDTSITRFVVMTVALGITLALGYVRFARRKSASGAIAGPGSDDLADVERRVRDLEERMNRAADALGPRASGARERE